MTVDIVCYHLEAIEYEVLAHYIEVCAQRIHYSHAPFFRISLKAGIVCRFRERVVHRLYEAVGCQEIGNPVTDSFRLRRRSSVHAHLHVHRQVHVVVAVDSQDFLDHVALAIDIHHIGRGGDFRPVRPSFHEIVGQRSEDFLDGVVAYFLANEVLNPIVIQVDDFLANRLWVELLHITLDMAAGNLLNKQCGALASIFAD